RFLRRIIEQGELPSLIFWGPPGSGKTTLSRLIAQKMKADFVEFSAVVSGISDIKKVIERAKTNKLYGRRTILFVDEIHRFNRTQQDAFLPHVEEGTITLIGATTENPSFEVTSPLLSRCKVLTLEPLSKEEIREILLRALTDTERGLGSLKIEVDEDAMALLCEYSYGDARKALNLLEAASMLGEKRITKEVVKEALQKETLLYDKSGEEHYNLISAFIKSMRGSDADAAVYWLCRMVEAGEDPLFIARRMVIFASEDIGNADPKALPLAIATKDAVDFVGMPEGWIPLAHCATYLARAPKSNASYKAYLKAREDVKKFGPLPVPLHLRCAPTELMKKLGYGRGYKYPHDYKDKKPKQQYLPDKLKDRKYYPEEE
ncbi:MAG TPA: replication-associated recombination protein A, partial [Deltaproteobacteria bacterium]|nr:replication-associated recombination protein A [Deltaproteobacteria bacterium]